MFTEMITINVGKTISFDHTFEVATNIGYLNIWVPQYDSLLHGNLQKAHALYR